jgi:hypothetical protein
VFGLTNGSFLNLGTLLRSTSTGTVIANFNLNNDGTVEVNTGTLSLTGAAGTSTGTFAVATGATLDFSGTAHTLASTSVVSGNGTLRFRAPGSFNLAGTITVANTSIIAGTANFIHDENLPNLTLNGHLTGSGNVTVQNVLTVTGLADMQGSGRTRSNGTLMFTASDGFVLNGRTLDNAGTATWTGSEDVSGSNGGVFNNLRGATVDLQGDGRFFIGLSQSSFVNAGILRKSAGSGSTTINNVFINTGTVEADTGTLSLAGGGTGSGTFTAAAGGTLEVAGPYVLDIGSAVTGAGTIRFSGNGAVTVAATDTAANTTVTGGPVNFLNDATLPSLTLSGGTVSVGNRLTVSGLLSVTTASTLSGTGSTRANGGMALSGRLTVIGGPLDNVGLATVTGAASIALGGGAVFTNLAGATVDVQHDTPFSAALGGGTFINDGTFRKSAGNGSASINFQFQNDSLVEVDTGTLSIAGNGSSNGMFTVAAGAALNLTADTYTLDMGSEVTGPGALFFSGTGLITVAGTVMPGNTTVTSTTVNFLSDVNLPSLTLNGNLEGPGTVTIAGLLTWVAGSMSGPGLTLADGGIAFSGSQGVILNGRTLDNRGTATWTGTGSISLRNGAVLDNLPGTTFDVRTDASFAGSVDGSFVNEGSFRKSAGIGTSSLDAAFTNTGTVDIATGGLNLTGAFTNFSAATDTLSGGTYEVTSLFRFTDAAIVTNGAVIILDGPTSQISDEAGHAALGQLATNLASAGFTLTHGRRFATGAAFTNAGQVTLDAASSFTTTGSYTQTSGVTDLGGGVLTASPGVDLEGGVVTGSGTVQGDLMNGGVVSPGGDGTNGILTVTGNYVQTAAGILNIDLGGVNAGTHYDQVQIGGAATLDGTLNVALIGGYVPQVGDTFLILTFNSATSTFATVNGLDLGNGLYLEPVYGDTGLTLVTMSQPESLLPGVVLSSGDEQVIPESQEPILG